MENNVVIFLNHELMALIKTSTVCNNIVINYYICRNKYQYQFRFSSFNHLFINCQNESNKNDWILEFYIVFRIGGFLNMTSMLEPVV